MWRRFTDLHLLFNKNVRVVFSTADRCQTWLKTHNRQLPITRAPTSTAAPFLATSTTHPPPAPAAATAAATTALVACRPTTTPIPTTWTSPPTTAPVLPRTTRVVVMTTKTAVLLTRWTPTAATPTGRARTRRFPSSSWVRSGRRSLTAGPTRARRGPSPRCSPSRNAWRPRRWTAPSSTSASTLTTHPPPPPLGQTPRCSRRWASSRSPWTRKTSSRRIHHRCCLHTRMKRLAFCFSLQWLWSNLLW